MMIDAEKQHFFRVTLLDDAVLPSRSGTVGHNESLDYLPGAVLHGIAANRWYRKHQDTKDRELTGWQLFHSGEVCFSDALPLWEDKPGFPVPLSFHQPKANGSQSGDGSSKEGETAVYNLCAAVPASNDGGIQLKQLRARHVTEEGVLLKKRASLRMKTAINPLTRRAAESQLFAYHVLNAGQSFMFAVTCFGDIAQDQIKELVALIQGRARIGRSRTAEYGEVEIEALESGEGWNPHSAPSQDGLLRFWLLSDLALVNEYGAPTLDPKPSHLGISEGLSFVPERSFLRSRRYSPFNAKRQCRDPERLVICRGSVLCYEGPAANNPTGIRFVGTHREQGLGRIACAPQMLETAAPRYKNAGDHKSLRSAADKATKIKEQAAAMDSPLFAMLQRRKATASGSLEAERISREVFNKLLIALDLHRAWAGIRPGKPIEGAPGKSQWGRLKEAANRQRGEPDELWREAFGGDGAQEGVNTIVSLRSGWQLELGPNQRLAHAFKKALKSHRSDPELSDILGRIAALGLSAKWRAAVTGEQDVDKQTGETL